MKALALGAMLSLIATTSSHAVFHLDLIDEVAAGVGGDAAIQYVEVRVLSLQNIVGNSRLTAFNCDGTSSSVLLLLPSDVTNSGNGARFVMASTSFAAAAGITPDFTWDPSMTGNIDPTCGMVCWGAPGFVPPADETSWDATDPNEYVDCVGYGGYTGTRKTSTHNSTPTSGTPTSLGPGNGTTLSLTRQSTTGDNATDFALACPSATNNAGATGNFGSCPPPSTTTTTSLSGSTTTSLFGSTTTTSLSSSTMTATTLPALPLTPLAGGGSKKTDCYGQWRIAGGSGKSTVRCKKGDPCDFQNPPDECHIIAQLCFGAAAGKCAATAVARFAATGPENDDTDTENLNTAAEAVASRTGQSALGPGRVVGFSKGTPPGGTCTAPFTLHVPLKMKRGKMKKGVRTIKTETTAVKVDKDKLKLICTP